jgi:site-specific recombinase
LAILLGMMPVIAQFFGLPLDVRHVTLSTATLAAAVSSLGWEAMLTPQFWLACAGIVAIGLLNVGVAFSCALALALRARDVPKRVRRLVFRAVLRRFTLTPYIFFWPTKPESPAVIEAEEAADEQAAKESEEQERAEKKIVFQRDD